MTALGCPANWPDDDSTAELSSNGQVVRDDGPETHFSKAGTPTMGGALILVSIAMSTLLWSDLRNHYVWVVLLVTLSVGAVGWVDDYRKVFEKNTAGLAPRWKLFWQFLVAITLR